MGVHQGLLANSGERLRKVLGKLGNIKGLCDWC